MWSGWVRDENTDPVTPRPSSLLLGGFQHHSWVGAEPCELIAHVLMEVSTPAVRTTQLCPELLGDGSGKGEIPPRGQGPPGLAVSLQNPTEGTQHSPWLPGAHLHQGSCDGGARVNWEGN